MDSLNNPLVSIIVNCFNGEKYLNQTLQSILKQTYQNWEVIFWDNRSSDNSKKKFYEFNDKRFNYYLSDKHTSLYEARNNAIKKSNGEIIAFLDTDDWWNEKKLERQVSFFQDNKVGLVYSNFYLFFENIQKKKIYSKKILQSGYFTKDLFKSYKIGISTILLRKTAFDSILGFDNQYNIIGDFDLVVRLSLNWKFSCSQEPLAYYRIHDNNFSFLNSSTEIDELKKWISNEKICHNPSFKPHIKYTSQRINFLKTLKDINEGKLIKAIKNTFFFPIGLNKIKLMFYIILPKIILRKFKKFQ